MLFYSFIRKYMKDNGIYVLLILFIGMSSNSRVYSSKSELPIGKV